MKIKKGDTVIVVAGSEKGKSGVVTEVLRDTERVIVSGVNLKTKAVKSRTEGEKGELKKVEGSLHVSNVMIKDPKTEKPTRVKTVVKDGKKTRVAKSGAEIK